MTSPTAEPVDPKRTLGLALAGGWVTGIVSFLVVWLVADARLLGVVVMIVGQTLMMGMILPLFRTIDLQADASARGEEPAPASGFWGGTDFAHWPSLLTASESQKSLVV